ncbi:MAG TPA: hypothetical protein VM286_02820 [Candidatus Thermoplasmatota archaeon]|nr:hypothetical protein [Candidatus Thermoplasmatota archaeon]
MLALTVGWEGSEAGLRAGNPGKGGVFAAESWQNMCVDIVVASVAWGLAFWVRGTYFWHASVWRGVVRPLNGAGG